MNIFRVLNALFKINIQQELAYRVDTFINILTSLMWLAWELIGLSIIFSNTDSIGGWSAAGQFLYLRRGYQTCHAISDAAGPRPGAAVAASGAAAVPAVSAGAWLARHG